MRTSTKLGLETKLREIDELFMNGKFGERKNASWKGEGEGEGSLKSFRTTEERAFISRCKMGHSRQLLRTTRVSG